MKQNKIIEHTTLRAIIINLSSETFSLEIDDIDNVLIINEKYPDILIRIVHTETPFNTLVSTISHISPEQPNPKIETTIYDYVVFTKSNQGTILNTNLLELIIQNIPNSPYDLDTPIWSLVEEVSDDWTPIIERETTDMDIPVDPLTKEEMNVITPQPRL